MKRKGARGSTSRGFSGRTSFKAFHRQPTGPKTSYASIDGMHVPEKAYGENPSGARVSAAETAKSYRTTHGSNDPVNRDWQKNRVHNPYGSNSDGFNQQQDLGSVQGSIPRDRNGNFTGATQGYSAQPSASFPTRHSHQQELESLRSLNHTHHHHDDVNQGIAHNDMRPNQVSEVDCKCTANGLHKRQYQQSALELRSGHADGGWNSLPASTRSSFDSDGDLGYMSDFHSWSMVSDGYNYSKWSYSEKPNYQAYADEGSGRDRFYTNPADSYLSMYYQHENKGNYGVSESYICNSMVNNPRSNSEGSEVDLVHEFSRSMNLGSAKQSSS